MISQNLRKYRIRKKNNFEQSAVMTITLIIVFLFNIICTLPIQASELYLSKPGARVILGPRFTPLLLKGMTIHPDQPLLFDFIMDTGNVSPADPSSK